MNMKVTCALVFLAVIIISCGEKKMTEEEVKQIGMSPCRSTAPFIKELGFDPTRSGMSTNEANIRGIVLVEYPRKVADSASKRSYQDVTWNKNGWMGQTTTDAAGNIYTAPLPKENEPGIPLNQMNKVYKIDSETGKMDVLTELPESDRVKGSIPFAVLGIYYDCHGKKLYVSSIAGSTKNKENGIIYVIDPEDGKITDELKGHDAAAVFVGGFSGEKRLYFGGLRTSDIYSVELTHDGKFIGEVRSEGTLLHKGTSDKDRARTLRFDEKGNMLIEATAFNYGIEDARNKKETSYQFSFDKNKRKWILVDGG